MNPFFEMNIEESLDTSAVRQMEGLHVGQRLSEVVALKGKRRGTMGKPLKSVVGVGGTTCEL